MKPNALIGPLFAQSYRSLRWSYPLAGGALGAFTLLGLLLLRCVDRGSGISIGSLWIELRSQLPTYAYLACFMTLSLVVLGHFLGGKEEQLWERSVTDSATGLANRRFFEERFDEELQEARRARRPLSLLMIDVDHLKAINDQRGHAAGDQAIARVAECLLQTCRSHDLPVRWGGDEFVVLAPWTRARESLFLAERIHRGLRSLAEGDPATTVSVSIGITDVEPTEEGRYATDVMNAADRALYQAKSLGRDRTVVYRPERR